MRTIMMMRFTLMMMRTKTMFNMRMASPSFRDVHKWSPPPSKEEQCNPKKRWEGRRAVWSEPFEKKFQQISDTVLFSGNFYPKMTEITQTSSSPWNPVSMCLCPASSTVARSERAWPPRRRCRQPPGLGKLEWLQGTVLGHQKKMIYDYHVLFKQQVDGVRIGGVWAVVEAKLCDEKEDDCDH